MRSQDELCMIYALCSKAGRFVFEVAPHIFPQGYLTQDEIAGWDEFYLIQHEFKERMK